MKKGKNRFREWLSDNLRYFILGFAMLVILALLYIGFYFLVSLVAGTQLKDEQSIQNEQEVDDSDAVIDEESSEETGAEKNETEESKKPEGGSEEDHSAENDSEESNESENNAGEDASGSETKEEE